MSYKKTSVFFLTALALAGIAFFILAMGFPPQPDRPYVCGPTFYPQLLSTLMVILSVCGIVTTLKKKEDRTIEFPFPKRYAGILLMLGLWTFLWDKVGYFYVWTFIFSYALLYYFDSAPHSARKIRNTLLVNVIIVGAFYLIFSVFMKLSL